MDSKRIIFKVEFEPRPIRHAAVMCPTCKRWYYVNDIKIGDNRIVDELDLNYAEYKCPVCSTIFSLEEYNADYIDADYPEDFSECLERKVIWE